MVVAAGGAGAGAREVVLGPDDGLPRTSAARCDFLVLLFKDRLSGLVATLSPEKIRALNRALAIALDLPLEVGPRRP